MNQYFVMLKENARSLKKRARYRRGSFIFCPKCYS